MRFRAVFVLLAVGLMLSGCGNGNDKSVNGDSIPQATSPAASPGHEAVTSDAERGEALFNQPVVGGAPGCKSCHSLEPGVRMVGPSLANIATVAATAVDGMSAEAFIKQSIVDPDAHVTEGFPPGLMFQDYQMSLKDGQINDLVAFLMTRR